MIETGVGVKARGTMKTNFLLFLACFTIVFASEGIHLPDPPSAKDEGYVINFNEVTMAEFVRFVSRIAGVNFVFNEKDLDYAVNVVSGKPLKARRVLDLLFNLLEEYGQQAIAKNGYFVIKEIVPEPEPITQELPQVQISLPPADKFHVYKLQYHEGAEILDNIKQIAHQIKNQPGTSPELLATIGSMQWVKATNSLLYSGPPSAIMRLNNLIDTLDTPLRQVFIEVLVVETNVRNSLEFGVDWAAGGKLGNNLGFGMGEIGVGPKGRSFAKTFQGINAQNTPAGPSQTPLGRGFDLSVIGDIILHKGKTFFTLGTLVSALEQMGGSKIMLNQKIITQDNKPSNIFVGENIPFTGSIVETIGSSQQTTANIEYRDVGVALNIKPRLGKQDIITLEISEEISQALPNRFGKGDNSDGILTTKTNMLTSAHVPDQSFLVLSGMVKNSTNKQKSGLPCLGGLPLIGSLFSKTTKEDDKKAILVFVRPQIINSIDDFKRITGEQQAICTEMNPQADIEAAMQALQKESIQ